MDPKDFAEPTLAAFVKHLRRDRGLTQVQLSLEVHKGRRYIEKLEQGTDDVSDDVLHDLTNALRLNDHERAHLKALAGRPSRGLNEVAAVDDIAILIERLAPMPAAWLVDWRIEALNDGYRELMPGLAEARSLPHWLFNDARSHLVLPDWQLEAAVVTGLMRHLLAVAGGRGSTGDVVRELLVVPEFRRLWESGVVYTRRPYENRRVWMPRTGTMRVIRESLIPVSTVGLLIIGFPVAGIA
ncbi:helix-turn-helix domain-containing protein [Nocardia sp. SYP-A9097]|uniref:helix-turn-helix domain-containing protein n=1 Tax=Nocardia sp. SYP-A9097 TaxID=2663237 RepID=UPI00129A20C8|nr:helix-turn-helix domain-containing protein [Nocardia sp. SYP-A9097]MRH89205.1 helix-turn-helix domain-containing protein [Nocardia sp. SYP-A9097]